MSKPIKNNTLLKKVHEFDLEYGAAQYKLYPDRSLQSIADEIGVTRARLFDFISANRVVRDLGSLIRDKTTEILAQDVVEANGRIPTKQEDIVAINATLQASIIRSHRTDIDRFRRLTMALLTELEGMTVYQDVLEDLGTMMRSEDKNGVDKLNDVYKKVVSLPGRTETLKKLGETLKTLIMLERQAFGMRDDYEDEAIRQSKMQAPSAPVASNFDSITRKFMKVMNGGQDVTDVEPNQPALPAT